MSLSNKHSNKVDRLGVLLHVIVLLACWNGAAAGQISRFRLEEDGGRILIKYNLREPRSGFRHEFDLTLSATFEDSTTRTLVPRTLEGDYGKDLSPGGGKEIVWNILDDLDEYDVRGDLEVTIDATVNRWQVTGFRRTRLGFELLTDLLFETDVKFRYNSPVLNDDVFEFNKTDFSLGNGGIRAFWSFGFPKSGRSAEIGFTFGNHGSSISSNDTTAVLSGARWFVIDGRLVASGLWVGLGMGRYTFGESFDSLPLLESGGPKYWYYEFGFGGKWRLGPGGSLFAELRQGRQIVGDLESGGDVLVNVRALRAGYSADLTDIWSLIAGEGDWERLPAEHASSTTRIEDVHVLEPNLRTPSVPGLAFVYVPTGIYFIGTPTDEPLRDGRTESSPQPVFIEGFFIGSTEVTQETYRGFADKEWTQYAGARYPAHSVTYEEARAFCEFLSASDSHFDFSLPSEVEWEAACRGGLHPEEGPVASEDRKERDRIRKSRDAAEFALMRYGWFRANKVTSGPQPVEEKKPNLIGLYDVHGNVAEWCVRSPALSWKRNIPGRQPIRGGSITSDYARCRAGARALEPSDSSKPSIGFRVVCRPKR